MLVEKNDYLTSGIYIGMKSCTPYMRQFVYKIREDGLGMFNLKKIDERLKITGSFLSQFEKILVVSRKETAELPLKKFAEITGARAITGRFPPGMLTNPSFRDFYEPDVVVVIDPIIDTQVVAEAKKKRIPIVSLANTFNSARDVDLILPVNNNGKKSLALVFWILAREILKNRGEIKKNEDFKAGLKDFGFE
jgi:small subunit ribosomal protein S2